jgi:hypothetical protein
MRRAQLLIVFVILISGALGFADASSGLNIAVEIDNYSWSNCPCTPTRYEFTVTNTGSYAETYDLAVDTQKSDYTQSASSLTLGPGVSEPVYVYMNPPCAITGSVTYRFLVHARASGYQTRTPFYLMLRDSCYSYDLAFEEPHQNATNAIRNITDSRTFCARINETYIVPVRIANTGEFLNTYTIMASAPLAPSSVVRTLKPGSAATLNFSFTSSEQGTYPLSVTVQTPTAKEFPFTMRVDDCAPTQGAQQDTSPALLKRWLFAVIIALTLILLMLFFVIIAGKRREKKRPERKRSGVLLVVAVFIALLALFYGIIRLIWFLAIMLWPYISGLGPMIATYWVGIVIALIVIVALIYLLRRERSFSKGKTIRHFVVVVCIAVLFLAAALCFYTELCRPIGVQVANESMNVSNVSMVTEATTGYVWNKNSDKRIDLLKYAQDADDDRLTFTATPADNITIIFNDDGTVLLRPDRDWSGERVINFIADDGKGGRAYSPDITLTVLDQEQTFYGPLWSPLRDFVIRNFNHFLLAFVFVVVLVIFLVLRTKDPPKQILVRKKRKA